MSPVSVSFGERNLVPDAGLLPAALLAQRIDLAGLIDGRLRLAEHGANIGTKALTVIGSMLAGGDHFDHTAVLRAGATGSLFDLTRAPSTVGTWSRAHKWSNVRQLSWLSGWSCPVAPALRTRLIVSVKTTPPPRAAPAEPLRSRLRGVCAHVASWGV